MRGSEADTDLVGQALAGDSASFAALCERHRPRVWRTVASVTRGPEVEDLAQEALVRAYSSLRSYRSEAPFGAWLCRIALNVAHDHQRSAWKRRVTLWGDRPGDAEQSPVSAHGEVERREVQRRVRHAVSRLPAPQRVPIWLHYFEEFAIVEIARLEGASESTIRSRIQAGLRRLSGSLEDLLLPEGPVPLEAEPKGCRA